MTEDGNATEEEALVASLPTLNGHKQEVERGGGRRKAGRGGGEDGRARKGVEGDGEKEEMERSLTSSVPFLLQLPAQALLSLSPRMLEASVCHVSS